MRGSVYHSYIFLYDRVTSARIPYAFLLYHRHAHFFVRAVSVFKYQIHICHMPERICLGIENLHLLDATMLLFLLRHKHPGIVHQLSAIAVRNLIGHVCASHKILILPSQQLVVIALSSMCGYLGGRRSFLACHRQGQDSGQRHISPYSLHLTSDG